MYHGIAAETLEKARLATKKALFDPAFQKAITVSTGLVGLNLEAPAKLLTPLLAPFRQSIPRTTQPGDDSARWKAITAIIQNARFSVAETSGANAIATTVATKTAAFKEIGVNGSVTRKAKAHAQGFEDIKAREVTDSLLLAMKLEEQAILGGNITALSAPTNLAVTAASGGALAADATGYNVRVAAVTLMEMNRLTINRCADYDGSSASSPLVDGTGPTDIPESTTVGGAKDGVGVACSRVGPTVVTANQLLQISWTPVSGAAGYVVYVGKNTTETAEVVTTQCKIALRSVAGSGSALPTADSSADALMFNGMIALIMAESAAYKKALSNRLAITSSTQPELTDLQEAFQSIWDKAKIDEFEILVDGITARNLSKRVMLALGGPTISITGTEMNSSDAMINAGTAYHVGWVVNQVTGKRCRVNVLPWLVGGTILIIPTRIPYPQSGIVAPFEIASSYGWEQIDYAATTSTGPQEIFDIRAEEVLKDYFPAGCGIIYDIWKG